MNKKKIMYIVIIIILIIAIGGLTILKISSGSNFNKNTDNTINDDSSYQEIYNIWHINSLENYVNGNLEFTVDNIANTYLKINSDKISFCTIDSSDDFICDEFDYKIENDKITVFRFFGDDDRIYNYSLDNNNTLILKNGDDNNYTLYYYGKSAG